MKYEKPNLELVIFETDDVITTSGGTLNFGQSGDGTFAN